jgi:CRP-like cAMP-binding protein
MMFWFKENHKEEFAKISTRERLPSNVVLSVDYVYYLLAGVCMLCHVSERGDEKILVYFREKALMGFLPYLVKHVGANDQNRDLFSTGEFFIKTRSPCDVMKVDGDRFFSLLDKSPHLYRSLLCSLTQNYANLLLLSTRITNQPAPVRVCRVILEFISLENDRLVLPRHLAYGGGPRKLDSVLS